MIKYQINYKRGISENGETCMKYRMWNRIFLVRKETIFWKNLSSNSYWLFISHEPIEMLWSSKNTYVKEVSFVTEKIMFSMRWNGQNGGKKGIFSLIGTFENSIFQQFFYKKLLQYSCTNWYASNCYVLRLFVKFVEKRRLKSLLKPEILPNWYVFS